MIQELYYILYYAKIVDGKAIMTRFLNEAKKVLYYDNLYMGANDLDSKQTRVFKRFNRFILKGGIISTEIDFNDYKNNITLFNNFLAEDDSPKHYLANQNNLKIINNLEILLDKIEEVDNILANKYLPTISKIREAKRYTKN